MPQKFYQKATVQAASIGAIGVIVATAIATAIPHLLDIPELEKKVEDLETALKTSEIENQKLETQLTPYKTVALELFGGSEAEALSKLLFRFQDLEQNVAELEEIEKERKIEIAKLEQLKKTQPKLDAHLVERDDESWVVFIDFQTLVPIKARWSVVTKENKIVAPIMMGTEEIHPSEERTRFLYKIDVNPSEIVDEHMRFSFRWFSIFYEEQGKLDKLKGNITRLYKYRSGKLEEDSSQLMTQ